MITNTGKKLSAYSYKDQNGNNINASTAHGTPGAGWEKFTCEFGNGILLGETIVGIQINYEQTAIGSYEAYFDDFLIEDAQTLETFLPENYSTQLISVYPNPSNGVFNMTNINNKKINIAVYNLLGELLLNKNSEESNSTIDLSNKPNGVYILRVNDGKYTNIQKLVKN